MTIPIYSCEVNDGLAEAIKSSASIAYQAQAKPFNPNSMLIEKFNSLEHPALAKANKDEWDLFWMNSILVSVGWNKNDDVFDPGETYAARNSPVHKQFNFMHNERDIIGHMTASIVLDHNGEVIPDTIESTPDSFDIAVASVLYTQWSSPELQERMDKIIAGIRNGEWYVSMECLFRGFDYAVITPEGENRIVPRTEASSFLTKHLRIYGGTGEFKGYKLGRMLRNFTFSGKGLVDNPANPKSIIFNGVNPFEITKGSTNLELDIIPAKAENIKMSTENEVVVQLRDDLAKANARTEKLETKLDEMVAEAQKSERDKVEKQVATLKVDVEDLETKLAEAKTSLTEKEEAVADLQKKLEKVEAEKAELSEKLDKVEAENVKADRVSQLVAVGASKEEADNLAELWASSTDEQFANVVELTKSKFDKDMDDKKKKDKDMKDKKSDAEAADATADLDDAEEEDDAAFAAASEGEAESLRATALSWTESFISGGKTADK